jgi:hypothetical protein
MKTYLYIIVFCFACVQMFAQTVKDKKNGTLKFIVSGKVTQISSYCGGAQPSPEILAGYEAPSPYAGKTFYIRKGKINTTKQPVILSFKADANGKFSIELPPGTYSIIQEPQIKKINPNEYNIEGSISADADCLKKWWEKPYYILEIKEKNITGLHFEFHHPCFISADIPCLQYIGPLPP